MLKSIPIRREQDPIRIDLDYSDALGVVPNVCFYVGRERIYDLLFDCDHAKAMCFIHLGFIVPRVPMVENGRIINSGSLYLG